MFHAILDPDGEKFRVESIEPDQVTATTFLVEQITLVNAIVISQSCDAERAPSIMMAPVIDFPLEGTKATSKWRKINLAATSLSETKLVYLPGNPALSLSRSAADFGNAFTVPRQLLEELERKVKRVASLGEKAVSYLQFRFCVMLTRVAQDDFAWPSREDIEIKIASQEDRRKDTQKKLDKAEKDCKAAEGVSQEKIDDLRAEVDEQTAELTAIDREIASAKAAMEKADELE